MNVLSYAVLLGFLMAGSRAAIWEFDVGGLAGAGLLGGNEVDALADSAGSGKEVGHNEIPGILYDDVENILEFHVGWGSHEVVQGTLLKGQYVASGLFGPAGINENASRMIYGFDASNGYISVNDSGGRTGFIHSSLKLVELEGYSIAQQEADLLGSRWYFNIMTTAYETGEIRGQLLRVVPEPGAYGMIFGAGVLGVGIVIRRRKILRSIP